MPTPALISLTWTLNSRSSDPDGGLPRAETTVRSRRGGLAALAVTPRARLKAERGITAHRERYEAERVQEFGFEAFLTKPIDPFDLSRTVASLVGR